MMARVLTVLLTAVVVVMPCASAQEPPTRAGRALALEDYYRIRNVSAPELSPNGRWVAFTVGTRVEDTNGETREIWLADASGSQPPVRVSLPGEDARNPAWTDDNQLRFAVGRDAFLWNPEQPAAARSPAPAARPGVRSADGRWYALTRNQSAPARSPAYATDFQRRHEERFKGVQFDWLNFQRDGGPFPTPDPRDPFSNPAVEIFVQAADGGAERQLTKLGLQPRNLAWSPDSRTLVFTADSLYREERRYARSDLWLLDLDGRIRRLTPDDGLDNRSPAFSPDGRWIAFVRSFGTDKIIREKLNHGGPTDLYIIAPQGGQLINLTGDWDLQAGAPLWSPDGRFIYFTATIGGASHLFRVSPTARKVEQVTTGERRLNGLSFDRAFRRMAYTVGRFEAPAEIHVADLDGRNERALTSVHESFLREVALSRADRLSFASADGTPIEGWLLFPYDYQPGTRTYPLIVSSHGGPHSASGYSFNFKHQYFAANGYFVLETNFRSSTGYGDKFLWATWGEWGTKDGQDVMAGVDHVVARYPIDRSRVGTTGHSYGGFMTNWLITQYPDRFAAAIAGAGIVNWVSDYGTADIARTKETEFFGYPWEEHARNIMIRQSPLTHAGRVRTPTLFVHGEVDQRVPYEEAEQMYTALKKIGVPARMIVYAGMPHGISGHWNNIHRMMNELRWWDQWLKVKTD
jgi:dipeptidyl aminopeptidase/acylaminoacyl peptidase